MYHNHNLPPSLDGHQEIHTLLILTNSTLHDYYVLFTAIFTLLFIKVLIFTNSTPCDYLYYLQLFLLFLLIQLLFIRCSMDTCLKE